MADMSTEEIARGLARLGRQFMVPDVYQADVWQIETSEGTELVPADVPDCTDDDAPEDIRAALADYVSGKIRDDEDPALLHNMWLARLSAPGYLDCTDWTIHPTREKAEAYLVETYDDADPEDDPAEFTNYQE